MDYQKFTLEKGVHDTGKEPSGTKTGLPMQPEMMMLLAERIVSAHVNKGVDSPVTEALAGEISFKLKAAREKHEEVMRYMKLASDALRERDAILGTVSNASPDNSSLKCYLQCVRDIVSRGKDEKTLGEWGFLFEYTKFKP